MSEAEIINSVQSTSSGTPGRSLNRVGQHHFVIDSPQLAEEITSADAFLAGISSCGVNLVERVAREAGVPVLRTDVTIEGVRAGTNPADFARIRLRFALTGPDQAQAEALVRRYQEG